MNSLELYACEKDLEMYFEKWEKFNTYNSMKLSSVTKTRKRRRNNYLTKMYGSVLRIIGRI